MYLLTYALHTNVCKNQIFVRLFILQPKMYVMKYSKIRDPTKT